MIGTILVTSWFAALPAVGTASAGETFDGAGDDRFGFRTASGDLNGDGILDLVFSAPDPSGGNAVYVYFGPHAQLGAAFDVSDADAEFLWPQDTEFGWSIAIGDVVGDGTDDLIVSAPSEHDGDGAVHVFAGPVSASTYSSGDATASILGTLSGYFGWALTTGDFDGDGKHELAAGACSVGGDGRGEAYLFDVDQGDQDKDSFATSRFGGAGLTGCAMANAGDFDGDGYDDLMIGSHGSVTLTGYSWGGAVSMVFGRELFEPEYDLEDDPAEFDAAVFRGAVTGENLGFAIAGVGDVNDDGFDDIMIGAPAQDCESCLGAIDRTGAAYLVLGVGEDGFLGTATLRGTTNTAAGVADIIWNTKVNNDRLGMSVDGAGFAGNNYGKWAVGEVGPVLLVGSSANQAFALAYDQLYRDGTPPEYDCALQGNGTTACVLDRSTVPPARAVSRRVESLSNGGRRFTGPVNSRFGMAVLGAGDLDGDGDGDLVFGAPAQLEFEDPSGDGKAYAFPGK